MRSDGPLYHWALQWTRANERKKSHITWPWERTHEGRLCLYYVLFGWAWKAQSKNHIVHPNVSLPVCASNQTLLEPKRSRLHFLSVKRVWRINKHLLDWGHKSAHVLWVGHFTLLWHLHWWFLCITQNHWELWYTIFVKFIDILWCQWVVQRNGCVYVCFWSLFSEAIVQLRLETFRIHTQDCPQVNPGPRSSTMLTTLGDCTAPGQETRKCEGRSYAVFHCFVLLDIFFRR